MAKKLDPSLLKALDSWPLLHDVLHAASEEELWALLAYEQSGKRRKHYLIRLYGRANKLRYEREYAELGVA